MPLYWAVRPSYPAYKCLDSFYFLIKLLLHFQQIKQRDDDDDVFLAVVSSQLPSPSDFVCPVFFLNSATKKISLG